MVTAAPYPSSAYKEVRGLSRGLQLLKALNAAPGGIASTTELGKACGMHRTTVKRLMETLRSEGMVRHGERDGQYYLTFEVKRLSEGFEDEAWVSQVATPLMHASVKEMLWPCDIATAEGGFMVVRESTHRWSTLSQHHARLGQKLPMFVTAVGRAYLSACTDEELEGLLEMLGSREDGIGEIARDRKKVTRMIRETRRRGYATNEGEWSPEAHFGAIAFPIFSGERLLAAINMIFPKDAVSPADLKTRFAPRLQRLAQSIGKNSLAWVED
ncbi:MAG: DNA-binding transcriptional regulator [Pseudomonadota bacterium]